jgi:hypothetical protein
MTQAAHPASYGAPHRAPRPARVRRSFEGVVASYVRELAATADAAGRPGMGQRPRPC